MPLVLDGIEEYLGKVRAGEVAPELPPCPLIADTFDRDRDSLIGVTHLLLKPRFVLGDITGFGKTPQTLVAFGYLRWREPTARLFVLTRLSALPQWRANGHKFLHGMRIELLGYTARNAELDKAARMDQIARWTAGEIDILISTYHTPALDWSEPRLLPAQPGKRPKKVRDFIFPPLPPFLVVAFDESQSFRGRGTTLYPCVTGLVDRSRYAWGLTATQLMTKIDDLYHLYNALRPGMLGKKEHFDERYKTRILLKRRGSNQRFWKVTGTRNLWDLKERIAPYYLRREKVNRPGIRYKVLMPAMGTEQRKFYQAVLKQYLQGAQDTGYLTAGKLAVQTGTQPDLPKSTILTFAQFAVDAPVVLGFPQIPSAKLDELVEYLIGDAEGQKVIIYSRYEQVVTAIHERLTDAGLRPVRITGVESLKQRDAAQQAFQTDPAVTCMVLNSAGGEAVELPAAEIVVFYDLPWSVGEFQQVLGRARRRGSAHSTVLIVLLGTQHTIDERSLTLLQAREKLFNDLFTVDLTDPTLSSVSYTAPNDAPTDPAGAEMAPAALPIGSTSTSASFIAELFRAVKQDLEAGSKGRAKDISHLDRENSSKS